MRLTSTALFRKNALLVFFLLQLTFVANAQPRVLTAEQWQQDLQHLASELPKKHREPFHKITRVAFDSAVAELSQQIPMLEDHKIIVGFARLIAMLGDGHTRLTLPQDLAVAHSRAHTTTPPPSDSALFFHQLPVRFEWFDDGLYIKEAAPKYKDLISAKVIEVGTVPAEDALEKIRPATHYDNEIGFKFQASKYLEVPEILHTFNLAKTRTQVQLKIKDTKGKLRTVELDALPMFKAVQFVGAPAALKIPVALSESRLKDKFWMTYLPNHRALYVQLNEVYDKEDELLVDFTKRIEQAVAENKVERLVLDLRHNPGGNNFLSRPLVLALVRLNELNQFGKLYTLIGRETFSAAQMLANNLEYFTNTLFVGEPSGASPSGYGDSKKFQLPNSKLTVRASSIYWRDWNGNENRPWTTPDIPVAYTASTYFKGQDPVLDAALTFNGNMADIVKAVFDKSGFNSATWTYIRYKNDSRYNAQVLETTEKEFGKHLLEQKKFNEAAGWYSYVSSLHPKEVWPLLGLAKAQLLNNKPIDARNTVEKALALNPDHKEVKELQREINSKQ
ncbi:tetratricopeptide repeat protein [Pontibacter cellulosilyticus]|uniref:Tetratricopeptide repeat protein n=1 Tax=Pontibacter cellulosilyticus TaxID=1720253 RepID=A0A923NBK9_9BACT|nr:tetratricopeptide repeat protein [Pontibacter cellulosilyticus]MBC5994906.1 tetratricopeptide repeat protein [Pontibacter cellulosilyticus]